MFVILNPIGAGMAVVAVFFSELLVSIRSEHFGMVMGLTAITEDLLWRIITLCRIVMRHEEKSAPLALIGAK